MPKHRLQSQELICQSFTSDSDMQARRQEAQAAMEHQFRESMAGPEWDLQDYEWCAAPLASR